MKNRIKRKLTSNDGISVLFGLLFFLVAAILSAVMISASVTAIKSVKSDYKTEQNYQTCAGAAAIIRDAITGTTVTETIVTETKVTTTKKSGSSTSTTSDPSTTTTTSWSVGSDANNFAGSYLKGWMQSLIKSSTNSEEATHDISISGIEGLEDVTCKVIIKRDAENQQTVDGNKYSSYDIDVVFTTGTGVDECILTLTLSGQCKGTTTTSSKDETTSTGTGKNKTTITTTTTTTNTSIDYKWTSPVIEYGDKSEEAGS